MSSVLEYTVNTGVGGYKWKSFEMNKIEVLRKVSIREEI